MDMSSAIDDLPPPPSLDSSAAGIDDLPPPPVSARGVQVYDEPAGPEQAGAVDRFMERVQDPKRWQAVLNNTGPYAKDVAAGMPPMALPASALGAVGKGLVALGEGQGLGYSLGRTALAYGQGAGMSAMDGKEGESAQDKIDRAASGGKLSGGIQAAAESVPFVGGVLGYGARRIGQAVSGVDDSLIKNYSERTDQVNDLIKQSGGDVTAAADQIRSELSSGIQRTKAALNGKISAALGNASTEATISAQPFIDELEAAKAKLNPNYKANAISDIDEMIGKIKSQAGDGGMLTPQGLYETKQYLNENSSGAYNKGGQIFTRASEAARAAKSAAVEARAAIKQYVPEISDADAQLSKMHAIEGRLNKNLLAPGTPDGALLAAGSGANPRNAANLQALENISGVPAAQRAMDLATAKAFAKPDLLSKHATGRVAAGLLIGGAAGAKMNGPEGMGEGALMGAALGSPMALKGAINAANIGSKMGAQVGIPQVAQAIRQNPFIAQTVAQLAAAQIRRANPESPAPSAPDSQDMQAPPALMQNGAKPLYQVGGKFPGMVAPGNIDLNTRPKVQNPDGSISTVRSMSIGIGGKEVLIPTVSDDGRSLTPQQAVQQFKATGKHLGTFASPDAANQYAEALHQQQAATLGTPGKGVDTNRAPSGQAAWTQAGLSKLGLDQNTAQRAMQDPKGMDLIHQASNYAPGSKALKQIQNQIQSKWGSK